ncbi:Metal-activated pyridoxal enzyme [Pyrenophora tritici-repentis]|nr:Metal-activated pyridoxal enzyme [Pyrenophora tritici-repentis]KAI0578963.1 Metal-activated pyridoxal enzyme [Pyrenophora tritici-repentis]KAI0606864.1 Metal-activated pyridoxal enzyme [Pyrenophora tritici-repentis]KAI0618973.1 Metal-activated pyridoxal enzyme [Pyrenophora tritici-repentis]PZC94587.1 amino acid aldolase or racemase [Pyrenophora tritici-repentis]
MPPPYAPKIGDPITTLDTPSMLVSLPLLEANLKTLTTLLLPTGVHIRPHLKTCKSAILAQKMVAAGCTGGCVAKLSEAEVMCSLGFTDVLITCVVVGGFEGKVLTLVDLDVGLHRTGVWAGEPAKKLAAHIRDHCPHLKLMGIQGYEGHLQHLHSLEERKSRCLESMRILVDTAEALRQDGHDIQVVTTGGTGTAEFCAEVPGVTEVQPGSFLFMDSDYRNAIGGARYKQSLTILSTVISKQGDNIVTIDAGLKSLTTDSGLAECKTPGYTYGVLGDEHGSLEWKEGKAEALKVGDRVEMVPSHIDPTVNLHDVYYAHRDGVIKEIWPVDARGCVQ